MQLTNKERMLLEDQKKHEQVCIEKYNNYSSQAQDQQLKSLFSQYAGQEQQHYNTIDQVLQGQTPSMSQQSGSQQNQQSNLTSIQQQSQGMPRTGQGNQQDALLAKDMLMTEKFVSSSYDTAVFESMNPSVRQALQHIQGEEQKHGQGLLNYLSSQGMQALQ